MTERRILDKLIEMLPVKLTDKETIEFGKKLAALQGELTSHAQKEKEIKDGLKGARSTIEGKIASVATALNQGYEYRPVDVYLELNHEEGTVIGVRRDTFERIHSRPMTEAEKQQTFSFPVVHSDSDPE